MKRIAAIVLCIMTLIGAIPICAYGTEENKAQIHLGCQYAVGFDIKETIIDGYYIEDELYVVPDVIAELTGQELSFSEKGTSVVFSKSARKSFVYKIDFEDGKVIRLFQHEKEWPVAVKKLPDGGWLLNFEQTLKAMGASVSFSEKDTYPISVFCPYSTFEAWIDFVTARKDGMLFDWGEIEEDQGAIDVGSLGLRSGLLSLYLDYNEHLLGDALVSWWSDVTLNATEEQLMDTLSEILLCLSEDRVALSDDDLFCTYKQDIETVGVTAGLLELMDVDKAITAKSVVVGKVSSGIGKAITVLEALDTYQQYKNIQDAERNILNELFVTFPRYSEAEDASFRNIYNAANHLNQSIQSGIGEATMIGDTVIKILMDVVGDTTSKVSPVLALIEATATLSKLIPGVSGLVDANKRINIGCNSWVLLMLSAYNYNYWMERLYSSNFSDEEALKQVKWVMLFQVLASITARQSFIATDTLSTATVKEMQSKNEKLMRLYSQIVNSVPTSASGDNSSTIKWNGGSTEAVAGETNPSIPTDAVEFNGHRYYLYDVAGLSEPENNTWENAQAYCEAVGGYLAAITSQEENEFLYNYMRQRGYDSAYFGLSNTQNGTWQWSSGEALSYINWHSGEPNNESNSEHYGMFYWKYTDGTWNDGDFGRKTSRGGTAFLCEWGDSSHIGQSRPETLESGFHYEMKTEVIEFPLSDGTLYYSNTIKYPYFAGNSVIESALNQRYADMIAYCKANDTDYDEQYQEWGDDEARLPYYDDTSSEVLYDGRGAISVKEIHVMWSGGMHPYHEVIGLNYDLATGKELTYHDILDGTDAQIDSALRYYYEKGVGKATDYIVSVMKEYTAYALCEEGLCFFYNVGDAVERAEIIIPYTSDDTYVISLSDLLP